MFPLPSGAPTTGNVAIIYWSLIGVAVLVFVVIGLIKFLYPSGSERLKARQKDESEALTFMKQQIETSRLSREKDENEALGFMRDQVETNRKELVAQRQEIEELRAEKERDREERHKTGNQIQSLLMWCESSYTLIVEIKAEWSDIPPHLVARIEMMQKPSEIFRRSKE